MATLDIDRALEEQPREGRGFTMGMRTAGILNTIIINGLLLIGVFITAAPYVYMIVSTFKPNSEIWSWPIKFYPITLVDPDAYPGQVTNIGGLRLYLENYRFLFTEEPFTRWALNSFFLASVRSVLAIFFSSLAGFAFAKYEFKGKRVGFMLVLLSLMLPFEALLIPMFIEMAWLKWLNTYWAVIVPVAVSPFFIFLMRQFMLSVPNELMDAARIDGCTEFGIFWRIVAPIQKPAFGILAILAFNGAWNDFLWPLIVLSDKTLYTINLGVALLHGPYKTPFGAILAGSFLGTLPIIVVFLFMQRQFIAGLTAGALRE